jgi:hypothetical protein
LLKCFITITANEMNSFLAKNKIYFISHKCKSIICTLRNKLVINDANNDLLKCFMTNKINFIFSQK